MARSLVIRRASGNPLIPATIEFLMDGNLTVPDAWDVGITVATTTRDGTDVNAAEAVLAVTTAVTDNLAAVNALVDAINTNIPTARAWSQRNSDDQYVIFIKPVFGEAELVQLTLPVFEAS
jgi:hypothetical protein